MLFKLLFGQDLQDKQDFLMAFPSILFFAKQKKHPVCPVYPV
jgi:hypothetical protein